MLETAVLNRISGPGQGIPSSPRSSRPSDEAASEHRTVGREDLLERLERALVGGEARLHLLLGPPGVGKSHVLRALEARLRGASELRGRAVLVALPEQRRAISLVQLLAQLLRALPDDPELGPSAEALRCLRRQREEDREPWALDQLRARLRGRAMIVTLEHLDELLAALGASGQQRLRELLDAETSWSLVASARSPSAALDEGAPLHGVFVQYPLDPLSAEQCRELLAGLADAQGRAKLTELLRSAKGLARVRAIHHLLGGNPGAMVLVSRHLYTDRLDDFEPALLDLADELEAQLRERLARLSPGQRAIMEALAESWRPLTVTELAEQTFTRQASVSGALRHLRREELVQALELGRERYYELADPLHRVARPTPALLAFAEVLRRWYADDLSSSSSSLAPVCEPVLDAAQLAEAEAILAQSPRIAAGRLRGRLASGKSAIMVAALVVALERNEQGREAIELLASVTGAQARATHAALLRLGAGSGDDPSQARAASMVRRVAEASAGADDARRRQALLQAFDEGTPARVAVLSDILVHYPILANWAAAGAYDELGRLICRLRPSRRSPRVEAELIATIESAWREDRLAALLPADRPIDGLLASASPRLRERVAYASTLSLAESADQPDADEINAELRRRLGLGPMDPAWPSLERVAELGPVQCGLVLELLRHEVLREAWLRAPATSPAETAAAFELLLAAGIYAWIATGRAPDGLARLAPHSSALLEAKTAREAHARLSASERDLVAQF